MKFRQKYKSKGLYKPITLISILLYNGTHFCYFIFQLRSEESIELTFSYNQSPVNKKLFDLSMSLTEIGQKIAGLIKIASIILITSAIGLELGNTFGLLNTNQIPNNLTPIFGIARFALIAHLFEGIIAAIYARSKSKLPFKYGIYTFFVGTVGLVELFRQENS